MTYRCMVVLYRFHQKCLYAVLHWFHQKLVCCLSHWNSEIDYKHFMISQNDLHIHGSIPIISTGRFHWYTAVLHWFHQNFVCCFSHWNSEIDYKQFTIYQNDLHVCSGTPSISPEMSLHSTPLISPEICLLSLPLKYWNRL